MAAENLLKFSEPKLHFTRQGQAYRRCFSETAEYPSQGKISGESLGTEFLRFFHNLTGRLNQWPLIKDRTDSFSNRVLSSDKKICLW